MGILRLEQLAPSLLLALFAGIPRTVWLEEPHHGVQFGVDVDAGRTVSLVDPTGHLREDLPPVGVRDRAGAAPGVLDVRALADEVGAAAAAHPEVLQQAGSATLALVLLRPPVRQRFAGGPQ